ncbi:MAG: DUF1192 domain-containing protein [Alphaproteobacteria bacterium]|nr:DUF1192 domain-containing protein [Alphaproteobacteria bacterium]
MDPQDLLPRSAIAQPVNLDLMSIAELEARIATLTAEIEAARAMIAKKQASRQSAETFFKKD